MKKLLATVLSASILIIHLHGQVLDPSFGNGGKLILNDVIGNFSAGQSPTLVQSDGKIVVAGASPDLTSTIVCRLNVDGTFDNSFGNNGKAILIFASPVDLKIQTDNKIIVAGLGKVARLNTNGTLDQSFNSTGIVSVSFSISRLLVQSDQKIILAGKTIGLYMTRLNSDGSVDVGFGTSGIISLPTFAPVPSDGTILEGIAQQTDNKIVVSGLCRNPVTEPADIDFFIARFNINGTFDNSFGGTGLLFVDINNGFNFAGSQLTDANNKTTVSGWGSGDFQSARLNPDGSLDNTFNGTGKISLTINNNYSLCYASAFQQDGKLLLVGQVLGPTNDFAIVRLNNNGTLDNGFNNSGTMSIDFNNSADLAANVVGLPGGRILVTGASQVNGINQFALLRLLTEQHTYFRDLDGDGFGNNSVTTSYYFPPDGYVINNTDCNDNNSAINPGAIEVCDGIDNNCDGQIDEGCSTPPAISINDITVYESQGVATLTVRLSKTSALPIKINYTTVDGTAVSKGKGKNPTIDYMAARATITVPAGSLSGTISIAIFNDGITESSEYFDVQISIMKNLNATVSDGSGRVTILNGVQPLITSARSGVKTNIQSNDIFPTETMVVKVSPNPSTGDFHLQVTSSSGKEVMIRVIDVVGRPVSLLKSQPNQTIHLGQELKHGNYLIEVVQGGNRKTVKVIKQ